MNHLVNNNLKDIHAVILAGGTDFGRCRLTSRLPAAFWPIIGKPALIRAIEDLSRQGITRFTICYSGQGGKIQELLGQCEEDISVEIFIENMPLGTGGCLREVARKNEAPAYFLCQGNLSAIMPLAPVMTEFQHHSGSLTVLINGLESPHRPNRKIVAGYLCGRQVIEHITLEGYCDIKEALVPKLAKLGQPVYAIHLADSVGPFRDWPGYLRTTPLAMQRFFEKRDLDMYGSTPISDCAWISAQAKIAPTARLVGPVIVLDDVDISDKAIVIGPTVLSKGVRIGSGALVDSSGLWEGARVGPGAMIQRSLLDRGARISAKTEIIDQYVDGSF